jgi:hypothetical protein
LILYNNRHMVTNKNPQSQLNLTQNTDNLSDILDV